MRYFTSDHHFGHHNIIGFCERPFADVDEMNDQMVEIYNSVIDDDDEVWFVGDLAMGVLRDTVPLAARLKGQKVLVPGNHDGCHPMHKKWKRDLGLYHEAGFYVAQPQEDITIDAVTFKVCHFPYFGDSKISGDRYSGLRPDNENGWMICGHVHDAWKVKDRQINVGVDVWDFKPVSEAEIIQIVRAA